MYDHTMTAPRSLPLRRRPLNDERAASLSPVFSALSDPVRLRVFDLIRRAGEKGMCSCDLVEPLGRTQPTISHHLKVLREAGLVDSRREGTWLWYFVVPGCLESATEFIG